MSNFQEEKPLNQQGRRRTYKTLNIEHRKQIEIYISQRKSTAEISRLLNFSQPTIFSEIAKVGYFNYTAEEAQKIRDANTRKRAMNISKSKNKVTVVSLSKKIENLEMQMEIIHDMLKELMTK